MSNSAPIGIFDSGIGGLSVWREIARQLPREDTIYFADQIHIPYGPRSLQEIRSFSEAITRLLLKQGCKIIVVACNAASAEAVPFRPRWTRWLNSYCACGSTSMKSALRSRSSLRHRMRYCT